MKIDDKYFVRLKLVACQTLLAKNPEIDLKYRVAFMAWGTAHANRHSNFKPGELAKELGVHASSLSKAIGAAKKAGLIMYGSSSRCLISPADIVEPWYGHPHDPCAVCDGKRLRKRADQPGADIDGQQSTVDNADSSQSK